VGRDDRNRIVLYERKGGKKAYAKPPGRTRSAKKKNPKHEEGRGIGKRKRWDKKLCGGRDQMRDRKANKASGKRDEAMKEKKHKQKKKNFIRSTYVKKEGLGTEKGKKAKEANRTIWGKNHIKSAGPVSLETELGTEGVLQLVRKN